VFARSGRKPGRFLFNPPRCGSFLRVREKDEKSEPPSPGGGGLSRPILALAPMQDLTEPPFCRLIAEYGPPDLFFTPYLRVYPGAVLRKKARRWLGQTLAGAGLFVQIMGREPEALAAAVEELQNCGAEGVDLNLGCPAPIVCRKGAGGALLREPEALDRALAALRAATRVRLSVKTRLGYSDRSAFGEILETIARHSPDLVVIHARAVRDDPDAPADWAAAAEAVRRLPCPVLINGGVGSASAAERGLAESGADGVMIGRGAVRNPWIFRRIRARLKGEPPPRPGGRELLAYLFRLKEIFSAPGISEAALARRLKGPLNYIAPGVDPTGEFLRRLRRAGTMREMEALWRERLDHDDPLPIALEG